MFFDTDCGGVVHNIAYLRFIEIARTLLAEQLGLALSEMARDQSNRCQKSSTVLGWAGLLNWMSVSRASRMLFSAARRSLSFTASRSSA